MIFSEIELHIECNKDKCIILKNLCLQKNEVKQELMLLLKTHWVNHCVGSFEKFESINILKGEEVREFICYQLNS